jgi:tetratricopeptide (TPR) repeat protein
MGVKKGPHTEEYLLNAVTYHSKHLEIGPDAGGRFVANTNLGLCYGMLGDIIKAAHHHQDALRTAIKMQTLYGQSIAVGNLGQLALLKGDFNTARTCFEQVSFDTGYLEFTYFTRKFRVVFYPTIDIYNLTVSNLQMVLQHLQLVQTLQDPEAEITAWNMIAKLNQSEGRHADSLENLEQARRIAAREGFSNELRRVHCFIGMYRGAQDFQAYADHLLDGIHADPEQESPVLV